MPSIQKFVKFPDNNFRSELFSEGDWYYFYCRAPFQLNDYPSDKCDMKKAVDYDVPCASSINDD